LIHSRCLAAISLYTGLRPTLSMSVASAAVAMSGSVIMFHSCLVRFAGADQDFQFGEKISRVVPKMV
jgi:hypothetical protein